MFDFCGGMVKILLVFGFKDFGLREVVDVEVDFDLKKDMVVGGVLKRDREKRLLMNLLLFIIGY